MELGEQADILYHLLTEQMAQAEIKTESDEYGMSMYGDSEYNNNKNNLYDEIKEFLEEHPVSELMQIVSDVIKYEKE